MMNTKLISMKRSSITAAVALATLLGLAGCASSISKGIDDAGKAQEVVFPFAQKGATQPEGIHANSENLSKIRPGLTKQQVYELLGVPHYREGFGAREWDYLLHLSGTNLACQLKLIYDKDMNVGSIYSLPEGCAKIAPPQ